MPEQRRNQLPAVRRAIAGDAETITRVHQRAALEGYGHIFPPEAPKPAFAADLARWEFWLGPDTANGRRAYVAEDRDEVVGVVLAGPDPDEPQLGHLAQLYVRPDRWGSGYGSLLYDMAMEDLGSRYSLATLWVLEANTKARSWYERRGWRQTHKRKGVYAPAGIEDVQYLIETRGPGAEHSQRR